MAATKVKVTWKLWGRHDLSVHGLILDVEVDHSEGRLEKVEILGGVRDQGEFIGVHGGLCGKTGLTPQLAHWRERVNLLIYLSSDLLLGK